MKIFPIHLLFFICFLSYGGVKTSAQRVAIQTDMLQWGTLTPNLGFEFAMNDNYSFALTVGANPGLKGEKFSLKHYRLQPEVKYWFKSLFSRHYLGATVGYGDLNLKIGPRKFRGDIIVSGLTYGYAWLLSDHLNLEASLGAGVCRYRKVDNPTARGSILSAKTGWLFSPVKCALTISYILR